MNRIKLLFMAITITVTSFAQITQEQIIVVDDIVSSGFINLENSGQKYFVVDRINFLLKIYNENHSIYKSIQLNESDMGLTQYPIRDGFYPYAISENLFDTDSKIEFLVNIHAYTSDFSEEISNTYVINEDGNIIFEGINQSIVNDDEATQFPEWISNTSNGAKMILMVYNENANDSLIIYNLPGTVPCYSCDQTNKIHNLNNKSQKLSNYPNPAKDYTIIEYEIPKGENEAEIQIYNMNGQLIKTYKVDKTFNYLRISTNELSNGTYIYNIKTQKGISKGKKLIINK